MDISSIKSWTTGRFQGVHKDHENLFKTMPEPFAIGIVHPQGRNINNPFTYEEIHDVIRAFCDEDEAHIFSFYIKWTSPRNIIEGRDRIKSNVPQDAVYHGGDFVHKLAAKINDYKCKKRKRGTFTSATEFRESLYNDIIKRPDYSCQDVIKRPAYEKPVRPWRKLVPKETISVYEEILEKQDFQQAFTKHATSRSPLERLVGAK